MTMLSPRFVAAMDYAFELHARQMRKGTTVPYMAHLLGVAAIVLEHGADEDEAIAALLHDAVEDQGGPPTRAYIALRFGERVATIVDGCTDADTHPKPEWRQRKEAYIAHLSHASPSVRLVSAADKLHNARAIVQDYRSEGEALWSRFTGRREGTLWYYRALADAFNALGPAALAAELARVVAAMEALAASPTP